VEPVSTATTPRSMSQAESRASRGEVIVPGALRQSLRKQVTKDFTQRDVHRMRNIGMSMFAEAEATRQPGTRGDPCPKTRKPPPRRKLMMMATRDLENVFQDTENMKFKRGLKLKRLPACIDPLTPPDEEDEECLMCDADEKAKLRVEAAARKLVDEGCDHSECYGCMCEREKGSQKEERELMRQEEALQRRAREWRRQQDELKKQEEKRRLEAEKWAQILKEREDREKAEIARQEESEKREWALWEEQERRKLEQEGQERRKREQGELALELARRQREEEEQKAEELARRQREEKEKEERRMRRSGSGDSWESDSNSSELCFPNCESLNTLFPVQKSEELQRQNPGELQKQAATQQEALQSAKAHDERSEQGIEDSEFEEDKASCHACSMENTGKKKQGREGNASQADEPPGSCTTDEPPGSCTTEEMTLSKDEEGSLFGGKESFDKQADGVKFDSEDEEDKANESDNGELETDEDDDDDEGHSHSHSDEECEICIREGIKLDDLDVQEEEKKDSPDSASDSEISWSACEQLEETLREQERRKQEQIHRKWEEDRLFFEATHPGANYRLACDHRADEDELMLAGAAPDVHQQLTDQLMQQQQQCQQNEGLQVQLGFSQPLTSIPEPRTNTGHAGGDVGSNGALDNTPMPPPKPATTAVNQERQFKASLPSGQQTPSFLEPVRPGDQEDYDALETSTPSFTEPTAPEAVLHLQLGIAREGQSNGREGQSSPGMTTIASPWDDYDSETAGDVTGDAGFPSSDEMPTSKGPSVLAEMPSTEEDHGDNYEDEGFTSSDESPAAKEEGSDDYENYEVQASPELPAAEDDGDDYGDESFDDDQPEQQGQQTVVDTSADDAAPAASDDITDAEQQDNDYEGDSFGKDDDGYESDDFSGSAGIPGGVAPEKTHSDSQDQKDNLDSGDEYDDDFSG